MSKGILYLCATPIGNLEDMSYRSIRILKEVDLVAAEDTRHTKKLFNYYGIETDLTSYHKFNIKSKTPKLVEKLLSGWNIAVVSDAGLPGVSDPGGELVLEAIKVNINVVPIPGPTAFSTALVASGLNTEKFAFYGFLPAKQSERKKILTESALEDKVLIFYEAPHRLIKVLEDMLLVYGDRRACVAREITKKYEEFSRGTLSEIIEYYRGSEVKGEITIVVSGAEIDKKKLLEMEKLVAKVERLIEAGARKKEAIKLVADESQMPKRILYNEIEDKLKKEMPHNL